MPTTLSSSAVRQLDDKLALYPRPNAPGTVVGVVNKQGQMIYLKAAGDLGSQTEAPMKEDSVFWIASCTKMVTALAAMQLIERGMIGLDDAVATWVPELADMDIIVESTESTMKTVKSKTPITFKMLLCHTAGFSYSWYSEHIRNWAKQNKFDELRSVKRLGMPLVHEPGTCFDYGVNMDWAGMVVERVAGMNLQSWCDANIFGPLGLRDTAWDLTDKQHMLDRLVPMNARDSATGTYTETAHLNPIDAGGHHSGGGGIFTTASDYLTIVSVLLNKGKGPQGQEIVKNETMRQMFENQLADIPEPGALALKSEVKTTDTSYAGGGLVLLPGHPKGWGLSFLLNLEDIPGGRRAFSAEWGGIANLFWHADPTAEIGTIIFNDIMPYGDPSFTQLEEDLQQIIYSPGALEQSNDRVQSP